MQSSLSIVVVSRVEPFAVPFLRTFSAQCGYVNADFVLAIDGMGQVPDGLATSRVVRVRSKGYVESVLDQALAAAPGRYILRMDDDETLTPAMLKWLQERDYESSDHWKFATANLWDSESTFIANPPLWPDHHTRLSIRSKAGGRHVPHAGSPYGGGDLAPVIFCHHKFIVKPFEARQAVAARYDAYAPGYGTGDNMRPFSLPETCYDEIELGEVGLGFLTEADASPRRSLALR